MSVLGLYMPPQDEKGFRNLTEVRECSPALSQMVAGMERRAVANASMARLRFPGVLAAPSPTTCTLSGSRQDALLQHAFLRGPYAAQQAPPGHNVPTHTPADGHTRPEELSKCSGLEPASKIRGSSYPGPLSYCLDCSRRPIVCGVFKGLTEDSTCRGFPNLHTWT